MKVTFATGPLSLIELAALCRGELVGCQNPQATITAICTDSSEADAQTAFLTLPGKHSDGEAHLAQAVGQNCPCVICSRLPSLPACAVLTRDREAVPFLLARAVLQRVHPRCVAVTGSAGKTTTKEFIAAVLSQKYPTFKTAGNHNSTVGMPLSLLEMAPGSEWAVLEMGMNAPGEIEKLARLAKPEIAAVTNVGTAHIGLLGSRQAILQAKLEILSGLHQNGVFLLNLDDDLLKDSIGKNYRKISLSANGRKADFSAKNIRVEPQKTIFDLDWYGGHEANVCLPVPGKHFVSAALFAYAAGISAGVAPDAVRAALSNTTPGTFRQQCSVVGGVLLIEDCYNASPESMTAALETLFTICKQEKRRGIAVLGDMLELGAASKEQHRKIGNLFARGNAEFLFAVGKDGAEIAAGALSAGTPSKNVFQNPDPADLTATLTGLKAILKAGDVVLIKASRKIAAERIGSALKEFLEEKEGRDHA